MLLLVGTRIGELVSQGRRLCIAVEAGVEGIGRTVHAGATEMVDQKVARKGGNPGAEAAAQHVKACQIAVELEEDLLREIFGVERGAGEPITDTVDTAMLGKDELLPCFRVARQATGNLAGKGLLLGDLFGRLLQLSLKGMLRRMQCTARSVRGWRLALG